LVVLVSIAKFLVQTELYVFRCWYFYQQKRFYPKFKKALNAVTDMRVWFG